MGSEPSDTSDVNDSTSAPAPRASIADAARRALRTRHTAEAHEAMEPVIGGRPVEEPEALAEPDAGPDPVPAAQTRTASTASPARTSARIATVAHERRPIGSVLFGRPALLVLTMLTGLAVAYVVVSAVWLAHAHPSDNVQFANARDAVLVDAQRDIQTINTLDYRKTDSGLDGWLEVSTGAQRDQIEQARASIASQVAQQKAVTSGQVLAAAVVALDDRSGTATVMATVEQTVSVGGKAPVKKRDRYAADMSRTGGSWKISSITLVPV
jgi:Mce-associated membrane protein